VVLKLLDKSPRIPILGAQASRLMPHAFCSKYTSLYPELCMIGLGAPPSRRLTFPNYNHCSPITTQAAAL